MIVFKGYGWLVAVTALLGIIIAGVLGLRDPAIVWGLVGFSGVADHYIGRKLNGREGRLVQDVQTGEVLELKNSHSFFWIPIQYWLWVKLVVCAVLIVVAKFWLTSAG